jgi:putative pantetheine hydrolase
VRPGAHNDITDVAGIRVGQYQRRGRGWLTGTTVVLPPPGTIGGADVRGGGPGTRDVDTLRPENMVESPDAICLSGGSAYGLATGDGVMGWLADRNQGFRVGPEPHHVVPIVPTAVLFDLGAGGRFANRPDASFGVRAAAAASSRRVAQGTVGAGTGAHAQLLKGGIGSASVVLTSGVTVAALVALNSSGSIFDPRTGELWALERGLGDEFAHVRAPSRADLRRHLDEPLSRPSLNTTLAVVATDVAMSKAELTRMAGCAHDGMARAIDPIHQYVDGDVVFSLATGQLPVPRATLPFETDSSTDGDADPPAQPDGAIRPWTSRPLDLIPVFAAAADTVARAIVHAALAATSAGSMLSYGDRFPSAVTSR